MLVLYQKNKPMRLALIFALTILFWASCKESESIEESIKKVENSFSGYKAAILEGKGKEAIKWVDQNTLDYYEKILEIAKSGDKATVQNLGLLDKWTVLSVRHRIPREEVLNMDGRSFFIYAVDEEFIGKKSVRDVEIGEIEVNGKTARGKIITEGDFDPMYFDFHKEGNKWKIDLTSLYPVSEAELEKARERNAKPDDEFILEILRMMTRKEPAPNIWDPLTR